jgi:glycosyltransferase involved in cell wall biosynthesis
MEGATAYVAALRSYISQLGLDACVRIEETPQDVKVFMGAADVIVAPSIHPEAFGCVVAEAGALEKCVVASDLGGFQDLIQHKATGWLFAPGDPVALAQALLQVLRLSPEERQRIGQRARQRICTHFSLDRYVREVVDVYYTLHKR